MSKLPSPDGEGTPSVPVENQAAIEVLEVELSLMWRRARATSHALSRSVHPDLEPAAYGLLSVLLNQGGMRLTELARCIGVGKPSVSRQISFLESVGLVRKEADPLDGRAQLIELTPQGKTKMREVHDGRQRAFHSLLAHWESTDLETLGTLIAKLNDDAAHQ